MDEVTRIRQAYQRRQKNQAYQAQYSLFNQAQLFAIQQRERGLLKLLKKHRYQDLTQAKILDLGCGSGNLMASLANYGAVPPNLAGVDLMPDRLQAAKILNNRFGLALANAGELPFVDNYFSLIFQLTVFTSILDAQLKKQIAQGMLRILKPDGYIIWYDFWANNPNNPNVRGINLAEIEALFPNCTLDFHRITLAPPLARKIVPISWLLAETLSKIPWLLSHYLGVIRKV
jgi:ubiquinone/menaquinone biosynthesis C-methylase UbiE